MERTLEEKVELVKNFLTDNFIGEHRNNWLEDYAEIMCKMDEIYELNTIEEENNYFKNVILKDIDYLNICVNDKHFIEECEMFYGINIENYGRLKLETTATDLSEIMYGDTDTLEDCTNAEVRTLIIEHIKNLQNIYECIEAEEYYQIKTEDVYALGDIINLLNALKINIGGK